ncbi:ABC transporter ATP-binding protein [Modestobacter lapidis]|nr:ABC transporter ATP-binding protein [Modestobacter lapidis]
MNLLEVTGLTTGYGSSTVVHGVDLHVAAHGVTALLGANGAGKTTVLRALSGFLRRQGQLVFDGHPLPSGSPSRVARAGIAHVPQGRGTLRQLTVRENLAVGGLLRRDREGVAQDMAHCEDLFPVLRARRGSQAGELSGGEQQMLAIGRAFMSRPKLLLLDEPSLGLAPRITQELFEMLPRLRQDWGLAVLVVEQNANLALAIADHAVVLEAGQVVLAGPAPDIAGHDDVRRAYLGD